MEKTRNETSCEQFMIQLFSRWLFGFCNIFLILVSPFPLKIANDILIWQNNQHIHNNKHLWYINPSEIWERERSTCKPTMWKEGIKARE